MSGWRSTRRAWWRWADEDATVPVAALDEKLLGGGALRFLQEALDPINGQAVIAGQRRRA